MRGWKWNDSCMHEEVNENAMRENACKRKSEKKGEKGRE